MMAFYFLGSFGKLHHKPFKVWPKGAELYTKDGYQFFKDLGPLSNVNKHYFHGERPFWNELTEHPNYDEYWQARDVLQHLNKTKPATLVVGGWYDTEDLYGPLYTYQTMSNNNKKSHIKMVMGPWYHGQWNSTSGGKSLGEADFGFDTSAWFQEEVLLPFFKQHLKKADDAKLATATMFETGSNRWRKFDQWPPKDAKEHTLYLGSKRWMQDRSARPPAR